MGRVGIEVRPASHLKLCFSTNNRVFFSEQKSFHSTKKIVGCTKAFGHRVSGFGSHHTTWIPDHLSVTILKSTFLELFALPQPTNSRSYVALWTFVMGFHGHAMHSIWSPQVFWKHLKTSRIGGNKQCNWLQNVGNFMLMIKILESSIGPIKTAVVPNSGSLTCFLFWVKKPPKILICCATKLYTCGDISWHDTKCRVDRLVCSVSVSARSIVTTGTQQVSPLLLIVVGSELRKQWNVVHHFSIAGKSRHIFRGLTRTTPKRCGCPVGSSRKSAGCCEKICLKHFLFSTQNCMSNIKSLLNLLLVYFQETCLSWCTP